MLTRAQTPSPASKPRILLVEDHEDTRQLLHLALHLEGFRVEGVSTAEEGLCALEAQRYDLLISDFCLPGQSGSWLLAEAISRGLIAPGRVLVITAHPRPLGVDGFQVLGKPFELDHLFMHVRRLLDTTVTHAPTTTAALTPPA